MATSGKAARLQRLLCASRNTSARCISAVASGSTNRCRRKSVLPSGLD
ncbi:hypothetical protein KBZ15_07220 [Cyanobium sp. BA20m-p-22]|nr:hypothetical protein [Cyanobium sp. BA20m-p-22]